MLKKDISDLINAFEAETWKFSNNEKLDSDMQYIYMFEKEIQNVDDANLKSIYDKLLAMMGIIRFKYGFESMIINNSNPELENLRKIIEDISLNSSDIINQYNYVLTVYGNYASRVNNVDFINNKHKDVNGEEGLYLAIESLKSLINNENYRRLLGIESIKTVLVDCVKLNNELVSVQSIEKKYQDIIKQIWEHSLSDRVDENGNFRMLFSNISNDIDLRKQATRLINRKGQASCSMISSDFIATYQGETRKIGFVYPSNSDIVMASAYDLYSRDGAIGPKNKEKGTTLVTPQVLEKIGMERAQAKSEDFYSSTCYNEVIVNSDATKPCGIVVIGLGEKDLNIDYQDTQMLSLEMNLPIYYIDTMNYKNNLSDADKYYIAFHSLMSYLGMSRDELDQQLEQTIGAYSIDNLISIYKEQLAEIFLTLKKEGNLSKHNMCQIMSNIIDISKTNVQTR